MKAMCEIPESQKKQLYAQQPSEFTTRTHYLLRENMLLLRTVAPWMLLVFLGQQVSLSCGTRYTKGVQMSGYGGRGKFLATDKMLCSWGAEDVGDTVRLSVRCKDQKTRVKGAVADLECQYNAKPQSCPGYRSDARGFWKQVARALKKLRGKVCKDGRALVRAGMCKRAPRDAHFKLDAPSPVASVEAADQEDREPLPTRSVSAAPTDCGARADHWEKAEEKCGSAWASVCNFLLSIVQRDEC